MSAEVRVLDDDMDLAASVARLLGRAGFRAQWASSPAELLSEIGRMPVACIVSDISMPDMGGFAFAAAVRRADPGVAIVFITGWPTTRDAVDAIRRHGGIDYLDKPLSEARLLESVSEGVSWSNERRRVLARLAPLSRRERGVLDLLARGYSNKLVAGELSLSVRTVEDHRAAIMRKTGAGTISELIGLVAVLR